MVYGAADTRNQTAPARRLLLHKCEPVDFPFLLLILTLLGAGLLMMFSASFARANYETGNPVYFTVRQTLFAALGLAAMFFLSRIPTEFWRNMALPVYGVSLVLLVLVLVAGEQIGGARRWFRIFGIQFQPSELAKFAVICVLAKKTVDYGSRMERFSWGLLRMGLYLAPVFLLILAEKHLSAIVILGLVSFAMLYVGGTKPKYLLTILALGVVLVLVYISLMGYAGDRITAWRHPEQDANDKGYQVLQSQYAIGSGGLFGPGYGRGRQKYLYLPEEHNDYIFAIVCEELGFVGAGGIILLFILLIVRGYWIAMHAATPFSTMLGVGLMTLMAVQTFLNLGVVSNLLPSTGVSLPFFSYGGTALTMQLGEMGVVLGISRFSSGTKR